MVLSELPVKIYHEILEIKMYLAVGDANAKYFLIVAGQRAKAFTRIYVINAAGSIGTSSLIK
jgi:hypothetical protein